MTTLAYIPLSRRPEPESHVNPEESMEEFVGQCALLWRISDWQWKAGNDEESASAAKGAAAYQLALTDRMVLTETHFIQCNSITAELEFNTLLKDRWCARLRNSNGGTL